MQPRPLCHMDMCVSVSCMQGVGVVAQGVHRRCSEVSFLRVGHAVCVARGGGEGEVKGGDGLSLTLACQG